jgi:hypothetical protein
VSLRALLFSAAVAASGGAAAADFTVASLFEQLARERPARAAFTEKKFIALLDRPVESSGELAFTPPDRLEKKTLAPRPESLVIERDTVTLERGARRQTLRLSENPGVAILVESIRRTLAGDLAGLTRAYSVALDGTPARWKLTLRPLDPSLGTMVERVAISGEHARVATVEVFQADGDRSVTTLSPLGR